MLWASEKQGEREREETVALPRRGQVVFHLSKYTTEAGAAVQSLGVDKFV